MLKSAVNARLKQSMGDSQGTGSAHLPSLSLRGSVGSKIVSKPFKKFTRQSDKDVSLHGRKRKRVDYTGMGGAGAGGDDDQDAEIGSDDDKENGTRGGKKRKAIKMEMSWMKGMAADGSSLSATPKHNYDWLDKRTKDTAVVKRAFTVPSQTRDGMVIKHELSGQTLGSRLIFEVPPRPLHDPMADCAIVLFDPTVDDVEAQREKDRLHLIQKEAEERLTQEEHKQSSQGPTQSSKASSSSTMSSVQSVHKSLAQMLGIRKKDQSGPPPKVPVVIDPKLAKILRPHQVEGVKFLYRCSTGLVQEGVYGSIMADGMGLGKTLQCIALMWTLLKQSPVPRQSTIQKCIIVCPSTLVRNWANELKKWLQEKEPGSLVIDGTLSKDAMIDKVHRWCEASGKAVTQPIMIVSYETLRNLQTVLGQAEVGLLLCDEGHRLKNNASLTFQALNAIKVKRRVILSGTPIQNDLTEYFALISFANPDLLGGQGAFHREFEIPILRGRDSEATEKEVKLGEEKLKELSALVSKFVIRRSNELNAKYLPIKYEHVVFCHLSDFQRKLYDFFIASPDIRRLLKGRGSQPLKAIGLLKKLCNHPDLVDLDRDLEGAHKLYPEGYTPLIGRFVDSSLSGKMEVLERFLQKIRHTSNDKVVLISNYTQTLDLFDRMCRQNRWGNFRLDGTMSIKKRQKCVDQFNDPEGKEFIFLLSSKAGGCGINLIGANRLVLFDPDWNPASDQQALARVWREGQKKDCFVYRFISTGSIEEKILQRQLSKQALSKCVVDEAEDQERQFSLNDLRELFKFKPETQCETHDTIKCKRCSNGRQIAKSPAMLNEDCSTWNHYSRQQFGDLHDDLLRAELEHEAVSFVFQFVSV